MSWLLVTGHSWALRAFKEIKAGKRIFRWDPQMLIPGVVIAFWLVAPAWLAAVIGEPSTAGDAAILGVGSQGFVLAFVGRTPAK